LNSDPKTNPEGIYMLSRFSFFPTESETFALYQVSEATRPRLELVRLDLTRAHGPKAQASSSK